EYYCWLHFSGNWVF
nr:immunoglobulin light chain junction region [Macaca mulatta]MOW04998.1 immunoglobulin light chain junction region [Macaca mulatta]MOW05567.1 immunoglobulin light chain junction region [Macaca mulatta]